MVLKPCPETGDILISRVNLAWPTKGEEDGYRFELFVKAFQLLLVAESEVLDGTPWNVSSYRRSFFGDLNLEEIISSSTAQDDKPIQEWLTLWPLLTSIHTSVR